MSEKPVEFFCPACGRYARLDGWDGEYYVHFVIIGNGKTPDRTVREKHDDYCRSQQDTKGEAK